MATVTKVYLQQKGTHNPHRDTPGAPCSGDQGAGITKLQRTPIIIPKNTLLRSGGVAAIPNIRNKHREEAKIGRHINMSQMKKQNKVPEKALNKVETSNQPDTEFQILIVRMVNDFSENCKKKIGNINMENRKHKNVNRNEEYNK